jgi:hypothetical protein
VNFGRVYCDFLVYIFYSSIFWDTRRWIKSKSTIRSIPGEVFIIDIKWNATATVSHIDIIYTTINNFLMMNFKFLQVKSGAWQRRTVWEFRFGCESLNRSVKQMKQQKGVVHFGTACTHNPNVSLAINCQSWVLVFIYWMHIYTKAFARFVDWPYYSESELCGGAVTVSFSKYLPW